MNFSKGVRKHIRMEKAEIRKMLISPEEKKRLIRELIDKFKNL
jgi:hypothetical protein